MGFNLFTKWLNQLIIIFSRYLIYMDYVDGLFLGYNCFSRGIKFVGFLRHLKDNIFALSLSLRGEA